MLFKQKVSVNIGAKLKLDPKNHRKEVQKKWQSFQQLQSWKK